MVNKYIGYFFRISVTVYFFLALYYFLSKSAGGGDEALFIADLQLIDSSGWFYAIQKGISIPYMVLTYPFTFLFDSYIALRLVNVLLFVGLLIYFYKVKKFRDLNFYALLCFFYSTVGYFMAGTNDPLFIVSLGIFIVETYLILSSSQKSSLAWWGTSLVVAIFTRELIIVYSPVILLSLFFILKKKNVRLRTLMPSAILLVLFMVINIPSLIQNGTLSYDKKLPPKTTTATWVQRQYYAQLLVNDGKLPNYNHPSWIETQDYLDVNGMDSLPATISEAIIFNPKLTVKEFFKDFFFIFIYGSRQLGFILAILLIFLIKRLVIDKKFNESLFIPIALLIMISIFSFIIISFVELRWLAAIFIGAIVYFYLESKKEMIPKVIVRANYAVMGLICWYGMYSMITKL